MNLFILLKNSQEKWILQSFWMGWFDEKWISLGYIRGEKWEEMKRKRFLWKPIFLNLSKRGVIGREEISSLQILDKTNCPSKYGRNNKERYPCWKRHNNQIISWSNLKAILKTTSYKKLTIPSRKNSKEKIPNFMSIQTQEMPLHKVSNYVRSTMVELLSSKKISFWMILIEILFSILFYTLKIISIKLSNNYNL